MPEPYEGLYTDTESTDMNSPTGISTDVKENESSSTGLLNSRMISFSDTILAEIRFGGSHMSPCSEGNI